MATSLDDLIQAGLETADCEKSNNFSLTEKTRITNEALSSVYDLIVATWQDYFATSRNFTLPSTNTITLAAITGTTPTLIYKELGLTRTQDGYPQPIDPLPGYPARNDWNGGVRRYWLMGQDLSLWPQFNGVDHSGTYVLDYIPSCPVLVTNDSLPPEMERWKELITVGAAIKYMTKRRQSTVDLVAREQKLIAGINIASSSRKAEARKLRPLYKHDTTPWSSWQNPILPRR